MSKRFARLSFYAFLFIVGFVLASLGAQSAYAEEIGESIYTLKDIAIESTVSSSGSCGENVVWSLTDDGLLTISGSGPMKDYDVASIDDYKTYRTGGMSHPI